MRDANAYLCPNCVTPWKCNGAHIPEPFADAHGYGDLIAQALAGPHCDSCRCLTDAERDALANAIADPNSGSGIGVRAEERDQPRPQR